MGNKLQGKVAVVTGGSAGIGLAAARSFVEQGARVFITGRRRRELDDAASSLGGQVTAVQGDSASLADIRRICGTIKSAAGRIDVLLVNAGVYEFAPLGRITEEHYARIFDTNVRGLLFTVQEALPLLGSGASVILVGSQTSIKGFPAMSVYNASKAAVRSFARTWIVELKGSGIRVNVLSPGGTETPGLRQLVSEDAAAQMAASVPLGRLGQPEDVARAAVFLASDDSSYISGIELFVDGGNAQH